MSKATNSDYQLQQTWTVADAKAKLSEILRLARAGQPQTIGSEEPCVVVSAGQFDRAPRHVLGRERAARIRSRTSLAL